MGILNTYSKTWEDHKWDLLNHARSIISDDHPRLSQYEIDTEWVEEQAIACEFGTVEGHTLQDAVNHRICNIIGHARVERFLVARDLDSTLTTYGIVYRKVDGAYFITCPRCKEEYQL